MTIPPAKAAVNHLARVIATQEGCEALADNLTNLSEGPIDALSDFSSPFESSSFSLVELLVSITRFL